MNTRNSPVPPSAEVEIKGTRRGLVIILNSHVPPERLAQALRSKLASAPALFAGAACELRWQPENGHGRVSPVVQVLREFGMEIHNPGPPPSAGSAHPAVVESRHPSAEVVTLPRHEAVLFRGVLRSGQRLEVPGNLVVMGHLNPGSVAEAGGHVAVLGRLAGTVRAGWPDNPQAVILAWELVSGQVAIAGHSLPPDTAWVSGPSLVRLAGGRIKVQRWGAGGAV